MDEHDAQEVREMVDYEIAQHKIREHRRYETASRVMAGIYAGRGGEWPRDENERAEWGIEAALSADALLAALDAEAQP